MIYFKKLSKLGLYAHHLILKIVESNPRLLEKYLECRDWRLGKNPVKIDAGIDGIEQNSIISYANSNLNGQYRVFSRFYDFSKGIPWNEDYVSGFKWEKGLFFRKYIQVDVNNNADVKFPRELSRFHHALILGQAYLINKDTRYYEKFKEDVQDWIKENPFMKSVNWGCTQDIAIRAVNWIWGLAFFRDELLKDPGFKLIIDKCLYKHGFYIYMHPERNTYNNHNHYISDLVGQIYLGLYFIGDRYAQNWLNWGIEELFREIRYQILPSGPSYERSLNYNRFVTEMIFSAIILLMRKGYEIPQDILYRLELMLEFVMLYTKPDGLAPIIGDQDDARLHPFSLSSNLDHRYLLCIGAVMFKRGDFKYWSGGFSIDCAALMGSEAKKIYDQLIDEKSTMHSESFPDAGFFLIRDKDIYMFINNSGKSKYSELDGGTHTHSDLLSFELYMGDKTFLVDPGTYSYSGDPKMRMHFRSSKMHNTLTVDDQNQNTIKQDQLWNIERDAIPRKIEWIDNDEKTSFWGEHSGYLRLKSPVLHQRKIEYNKLNRTFLISDNAIGEGEHMFDLFFHFDVGIELEIQGNTVKTVCNNGTNIELNFVSDKPFTISCTEELVSKAYGDAVLAKTIKLHTNTKGTLKIETTIKKDNS